MAIRYLKIALTAVVALMALLFALQNLANLEAVYASVAYVLGMEGHEAHPHSIGPAITAPALIWIALAGIILVEIAVGLLAGKGAWDLWRSRKLAGDRFDAAKTYAVLGCGAAILVWFGLFIVVAGGYFQMWQTEIGRGSMENAFQLAAMSGLVLLIVNTPER